MRHGGCNNVRFGQGMNQNASGSSAWRMPRMAYGPKTGILGILDRHENGTERSGVQARHYEIGWCGQNASLANSMLADYLNSGNEDSLHRGLAVLDGWTAGGRLPNGMIHCQLRLRPAIQAGRTGSAGRLQPRHGCAEPVRGGRIGPEMRSGAADLPRNRARHL